jgi:hypothetical protein
MTLATTTGMNSIATVDANADGRRDIVTANGSGINFYFADTLPPVSTPATDSAWHASPHSFGITAVDQNGTFGTGVASIQYAFGPAGPWFDSDTAVVRTWKRGGGSGLRTVYHRAVDAVGNTEVARQVTVKVDGRAPSTTDDAPSTTTNGPVTVTLTATDRHAGVATTWYSLDGGDPVQGTAVGVEGAGVHWVAYSSVDNVGNVETAHWCSVTISAAGAARARPAVRYRR